jgi:hypothetical protein
MYIDVCIYIYTHHTVPGTWPCGMVITGPDHSSIVRSIGSRGISSHCEWTLLLGFHYIPSSNVSALFETFKYST